MSSKKKKNPKSGGSGGDSSMDERFLRIQKDPRFWEMPEREQKIKIDKRFQSMFHDERFKVKYTVDKRGRPMNHTSTEDLRRFYKLSESEEDDEDEEKSDKIKDKKSKKMTGERSEIKESDEEDDDQEEEDDIDEDVTDDDDDEREEEEEEEEDEREISSGSEDEESSSGLESDEDSGPDLARGKGNIETSSDEDEEDDIDAFLRKEADEIEHDWGELCKDAPRNEATSARLAVCNMDWDRIKAKDLLALFNSFLPKGGAVLSVKIYPSDFGKERLKMEQAQGPLELKPLPEDSEDDNEEEKVYREKMRDYQFKRLKYYYAVVECDSVDTATKIYEGCDGYEYESSCSMIDLRFIPDDVTFDEEPKDIATDVNLITYTPKVFTSSAASTSKVELTWDETDHERVTALNRKFNKEELLDMDFRAYLASSSEDEEEEGEQEITDETVTVPEAVDKTEEGTRVKTVVKDSEEEEEQQKNQRGRQQGQQKKSKKEKSEVQLSKYRDLLRGIQDKEKKLQEDKDMEMEITWVPGLKETTEQLVKKKMEVQDPLTPWQEFLQKKKEKKKQKKSQRKIQEGAESGEDLSDDELPPDVDLSDPFFAEELKATNMKKNKKGGKKATSMKMQEEDDEELEKQKAEMALLMEDDADESKHKHFNYDKIVEQQNLSKKKRKKLLKKGDEPLDDDFQVDVADPRFQAMFTSHLFNLDPSNPNFKKTKATQSILAEKQRRREVEEQQQSEARVTPKEMPVTQKDSANGGNKRENDTDASPVEKKKELDPSLSLLVKSIKSKTQQFQARKKPKLA